MNVAVLDYSKFKKQWHGTCQPDNPYLFEKGFFVS